MWGPISKKMFGPDAGFGNVFYPKEKGAYRMDITKCPYNSYFTELGSGTDKNLLYQRRMHLRRYPRSGIHPSYDAGNRRGPV